MLVKDVMTVNPVTIGPDASVLEARETMTRNKINKLPVVDRSGALVGIITNNDLAKASPSAATSLDMFELGYLLSKLSVEKTMVKSVKTTTADQTVEEAARLMNDYGISALPVVKENLLIGIVTESDLFSTFIDMFNTRASGVRAVAVVNEIPGELAKIAAAIAEKNANIVSLVTSDACDSKHRTVTLKVSGISKDELQSLLEANCAEIKDIRSV
ncbi:CBS domain-containing protein [Treponema sp.]|uniref:CBS domain-containing protein n=1 Tax=Treponema sp. TaxID=166 RepID=UPI003F120447